MMILSLIKRNTPAKLHGSLRATNLSHRHTANLSLWQLVLHSCLLSMLLACGSGGSNTSDNDNPEPPPAVEPPTKTLAVTVQPPSQRLTVDQIVEIKANVEGGVGPWRYDWQVNGNTLSTEEVFSYQFSEANRYDLRLVLSDSQDQQVETGISLDVYHPGNVEIKLLGFNDFHGQLSAIDGKGGSRHLAAHLLTASESARDGAFLVHGGDHVGGSPANSALLQDEPAISYLNLLKSALCQNASVLKVCDVMGTAGNHEFDEGSDELLRLINGSNHVDGPFLQDPWEGANFLTLSANVYLNENTSLLLPAYKIHEVAGVKVAFVGITLDSTPNIVYPGRVDNLEFIDQGEAANEVVSQLRAEGIESFVFLVHDGTSLGKYEGATRKRSVQLGDRFGRFIDALPSEVDVVIAGHTHGFTNALVNNSAGHPILITQAFSKGRAYSHIDIEIDPVSKDIVKKSARVIDTANSESLSKSQNVKNALTAIDTLVEQANEYTETVARRVLNQYRPKSGEISLGQFIANAHRFAMNADLGVTNRGGIRGKLSEGDVTWGDLFTIQPWQNDVVVRKYRGSKLIEIIEGGDIWSSNLKKVQGRWYLGQSQIASNQTYKVAGNGFIMDNERYNDGGEAVVGPKDIETLVEFIEGLPTPFNLNMQP